MDLTQQLWRAWRKLTQATDSETSALKTRQSLGLGDGVVGIELFLVSFIAPAFTAGAISSERERQTYDLLRTTLLPARALVLGKLLSALSYVALLLLVALPLQSLAFLLGGVAIEEVLIAAAVLLVTALASGSMGVFFSSLVRRTLGATVLTYAFALLTTVGLPLLLLIFVPVANVLYPNTPPPAVMALLVYGLGLLISLNPLATAIATEVILIQEQSALYFTLPLPNGTSLPLVSPWIVYVMLYSLLSVVLIWWSVRLVKRVDA
ncbi:MAG: ABC transporter permease [Chloroflexi bacterium]|nr:ABC transporter permease [Chloroflexota bacterium]